MNIAVIPARGGSKRIPKKNTREFCGKPIIAYSIEAAKASNLFERVIVSTDCETVAEVAHDYGAEVPFRRPIELSDDFTPLIPVVRHALEFERSPSEHPEFVCCILATAPLIRASDLQRSLELLEKDSGLDFVFPITTFAFPIQRSLKIDGHRVSMFYPEHLNTRSQDLPEAWHDAGQFYWGRTGSWLRCNGVFSANSAGLPLPRSQVQDIDTYQDWSVAELLYQTQNA